MPTSRRWNVAALAASEDDGVRGDSAVTGTAYGARRPMSILYIYAVCQATAVLLAPALAERASWAVSLAAAGGGAITLVACIIHFRPDRTSGWWLAVAGSLVLVTVLSLGRLSLDDGAAVARIGVTGALLLTACGLVILGRRRRATADSADVLDAILAAAGAVLLTWVMIGSPLTHPRFAETAGVALAAIFVFAAAAKLIFAGGLRVPALLLVVLAAGASLAALSDAILPTVELAELAGSRAARTLVAVHGSLLGAAGLHRSFVHSPQGLSWGGSDLSVPRIVLFALIAAFVPVAIVVGFISKPPNVDRTVIGVTVPVGAATAVLLTLVGRLVLIARVSQRRSVELARRSGDLAKAYAQEEALREELAFRAMHDPLTGLNNRVVLAERLEWALARPGPQRPVLMLLDLDGFKDVNDTYGHPVGDEILAEMARRLRLAVPEQSVVARLGGDEFAILFGLESAASASRHAADVLAAIQRPITVDDQRLFLSASIGLLVVDRAAEPTVADALRDADLALYAAKQSGKNRIMTFRPQMREDRLDRTRISTGLRRALARGELALAYQPIVALPGERVVAVEALARWQPPDGAQVPPALFIPVAEATGLIDAIGARMLRQACADACAWYRDHDVAVSVNVSGRQLDDPEFASLVSAVLEDTGLPAAGLILELTEDVLVAGVRAEAPVMPATSGQPARADVAAGQLRKLRDLGVRIAIDDFGTGYSSLAYLSTLPVDIVKLDRSFVAGIDTPAIAPSRAMLLSGILDTISSVGLRALVEGVETAEQAAALRPLRCDYAQGHYYHRPVPASALRRVLTRSH